SYVLLRLKQTTTNGIDVNSSGTEAHEKGEGYQALNIRVRDAVQKRAEEKILLFGSNGKAEGWFEK
ncbi:MAG: hypothetical protein ACLRZZ_06940, partial [Enterocloster sp.]